MNTTSAISDNSEMMQFLKKYSAVDNVFVDDFFSRFGLYSANDEFLIDLAHVSKWLGVHKYTLMKTLRASYRRDKDYQISKPPAQPGRGNNTRRIVLLTPDCFRMLCMQSRAKKSDEVRAYFLAVEKTLMLYRQEITDAMDARIGQLRANQRPKVRQSGGVIYVIRSGHGLYKLGRTTDLTRRLQSHQSAMADDVDVLFVYKTECVEAVERCAKDMLKRFQYRRHKEVYETDLAMVKDVVMGCGHVCNVVQRTFSRVKNQQDIASTEGKRLYMVFQRNAE